MTNEDILNLIRGKVDLPKFATQTGSTIDMAVGLQERAAFAGTLTLDTFLNVSLGRRVRLRTASLNNVYTTVTSAATTTLNGNTVQSPIATAVVPGSIIRVDGTVQVVTIVQTNLYYIGYLTPLAKSGTAVVELLTPDVLAGPLVFDSGTAGTTTSVLISTTSSGAIATPLVVVQGAYSFVPGAQFDIIIEVTKTTPLTFAVEIIPNVR